MQEEESGRSVSLRSRLSILRFPFRFDFVFRIRRLPLAEQQPNRHFRKGQAVSKKIEQIPLIRRRKSVRHVAKQYNRRW